MFVGREIKLLKEKLMKSNIDSKIKETIIEKIDGPGNSSFFGSNGYDFISGIASLNGRNLYYVQGFSSRGDDYPEPRKIIEEIYGKSAVTTGNMDNAIVDQAIAEKILLKYLKPKFSNPKVHVLDTELYYDPTFFIGYSWPLEAVADKLQSKDVKFVYGLFDK